MPLLDTSIAPHCNENSRKLTIYEADIQFNIKTDHGDFVSGTMKYVTVKKRPVLTLDKLISYDGFSESALHQFQTKSDLRCIAMVCILHD